MSSLGPCPRCGEMLPGLAYGSPPTVHCGRCGSGYMVGAPAPPPLAPPAFAPPAYSLPSPPFPPPPLPPPRTFAPPLPPADPIAVADQQFLDNPLGYIVHGPQLATYQAKVGSRIDSQRRWQFSFWVAWLVLILLAGFGLPFFSLKNGADRFVVAIVANLFFLVTCLPFFFVGMILLAGGLFEWSWFMNSRKARIKRGVFGDSGARKYYLGFGGTLMVISGIISLGGCLLFGTALALQPPTNNGVIASDGGDGGEGNAAVAGGPEARPVVDLEAQRRAAEAEFDVALQNVTLRRRKFEASSGKLHETLEKIEASKTQVEARPNELALRTTLVVDQRRVAELYATYSQDGREWLASLEQLDAAAKRAGKQASSIDVGRSVPGNKVITDQVVPRPDELFPVDDVVGAAKDLELRKKELRELPPGIAGAEKLGPALAELEILRARLLEIESKFGYHDPSLEGIPNAEELRRSLVASLERIPADAPRGSKPPGRAAKTPVDESPDVEAFRASIRKSIAEPPKPIHTESFPYDLLEEYANQRRPYNQHARYLTITGKPQVRLKGIEGDASFGFTSLDRWARRYDATVVRIQGDGPLFFVVSIDRNPIPIVIDAPTTGEPLTGLAWYRRQEIGTDNYKFPAVSGTQLPLNVPTVVSCLIQDRHVSLLINKKPIFDWEYDEQRFPMHRMFDRREHETLHFGCYDAEIHINALTTQQIR